MTTTAPVERASNPTSVLTDEMLARFDERAPIYDRHNQFFDEDFAELRASGFLDIAIPTEFGGGGAGLDEYSQLLRRLSYYAPATALAVNMHVYWTGVAADLLRAGDESCRFILDRAAAGEVLCALHGEPGNDMPLGAVDVHRRANRRRLVDQRSQDLRQPHARVDVGRVPRHGRVGSGGAADRPRLRPPQHFRA